MYYSAGLFHKFRFLIAGIFIVAFFMAVSALVTSLGSNTVLNPKFHSAANLVSAGPAYDSPNIVTSGASALTADSQRALISIGTGIYKTCKSVTVASGKSGKSLADATTASLTGIWKGISFVSHSASSLAMFTIHATGSSVVSTLRMPATVAAPIIKVHAVSALIRPAEEKDDAVPVITAETSSAVLARLSAVQQQEISKLQAAQVTANESMDGSIVAGDPNRGGYPAQWDNIAQDSTIDRWGMYNRECVSYAAWKVYQTFGDMPYWGGVGNANEWVRDAVRAGIPTGSTPAVHSVAIWRVGYYGHAMWVEKVSGSMIYVSQYNYDLHGHYSEMWVNANRFTYIYFH